MASNKILNDKLRERYLTSIMDILSNNEEVLRTGSNEFAIPCLDDEHNDKFIVITVKVPTGSRDGEEYDGYSMAEDYAIKCRLKEEKAKEAEKKKKEKMEKDKKRREEQARLKEEREKKRNEQ